MLGYNLLAIALAVVVFGAVIYRALTAVRADSLRLFTMQVFLTRFSWLAGLAPLALFLISQFWAPELLGSLFVLSGFIQFALIGMMSLGLAATVLVTSQVALENGPFRFPEYRILLATLPGPAPKSVGGRSINGLLELISKLAFPAAGGFGAWRWGLLLLLTCPVPVACLWQTSLDSDAHGRDAAREFAWHAAAVLVGVIAGLGAIWGFGLVQHLVLYSEELSPAVLPLQPTVFLRSSAASFRVRPFWKQLIAGLAHAGPGYLWTAPVGKGTFQTRLAPGLGQAAGLLLITLGCYFSVYTAVRFHLLPIAGVWDPPLASAFLLFILLGFLLPGLSFYLDYYHIPTILFMLVVSYCLFWINDTDHVYILNPDIVERPDWSVYGFVVAAAAVALLTLLVPQLRPYRIYGLLLSALLLCTVWWRVWNGDTPWSGVSYAEGLPTREPPILFEDTCAAWQIPFQGADRPGLVATAVGLGASSPCGNVPICNAVACQMAARFDTRPSERVLVVVTCSGGGIQAAAWTAKVLTGLHERYGWRFTRSIRLISAVSGGSLGTAYYLANWDETADQTADPFTPERIQRINRLARESSLEASVWGLAYPDLLRFISPPAVSSTVDRGWAIEQAWSELLARDCAKPDWRLRSCVTPARNGKLPVPAFNATLAETGQRLVIAPVVLKGSLAGPPEAVEFGYLFPHGADLRVATAVRLSAAFPYVSPISRPHRLPMDPSVQTIDAEQQRLDDYRHYLQNCHVVDGGYSDNEGATTASNRPKRALSTECCLCASSLSPTRWSSRRIPWGVADRGG